MANVKEEDKAALTIERGKQAAKISDSTERKNYVSDSADVDKDYAKTQEATALKGNQIARREIMGSMKKGGTIPKTGLYKMHKDEKVIPADKAKAMKKKEMDKATDGLASAPKAKRGRKEIHMTIKPTSNKGFIVEHAEHTDGMPSKHKSHAFAHAAEMHKHVAKVFPAKAMPTQEPTPEPMEAAAPAASPAAAPMGAMPEQA